MEGLYHASITRSRPRGLARSRASASVKSALPKSGNIDGASIIMAPRKFSGPIQRGAIRVLRDMEVASTSDIMPITHPRQHNPQHRSRSLRRVLDEIERGNAVVIAGDSFAVDNAGARAQACQRLDNQREAT